MFEKSKHALWARYLAYLNNKQERRALGALEKANPKELSFLREKVHSYLPTLKDSKYERLIYGMAIMSKLDPIDTAINAHYWMQTLGRENVQSKLLLPWRRRDIFIASQGARMSQRFLFMDKIGFIKRKVLNHNENLQKIGDWFKRRESLASFANKPLMIVSNHSGWQNLPYILALVQESLGCSLSRITTVIGPAVANLQAAREVAGMGNLINVVPSTGHGKLPDALSQIEKEINKQAWDKLKEMAQKPGPAGPNIVIMCPFGTTDKKDGKAQVILDNKKGAITALSMAMFSGFNILPISTYEQGVLSGTSLGRKGRVNIELGEIYTHQGLKGKVRKELAEKILEDIRAGIKDSEGRELAQFAD